MVLLPGGLGGVHSILASETAMNFIRLAYEKNCYVAAICAAPTILARLHITDGRKATCYPGMEDQMGTAQMIPCGAVQDGNVLTGNHVIMYLDDSAVDAEGRSKLVIQPKKTDPAPKKEKQ